MHLEQRLGIHAACALAATAIGYYFNQLNWAILALGGSFFLAFFRQIKFHHHPGNIATLARSLLILSVTFLQTPPLILATASIIALLLDALDGKLARSSGTQNEAGAQFDIEADALMVWCLAINFLKQHHMGAAMIVIAASRYSFCVLRRLLFGSNPTPIRHPLGRPVYIYLVATLIAGLFLPSEMASWLMGSSGLLLFCSFYLDFYYLSAKGWQPTIKFVAILTTLNTLMLLPSYLEVVDHMDFFPTPSKDLTLVGSLWDKSYFEALLRFFFWYRDNIDLFRINSETFFLAWLVLLASKKTVGRCVTSFATVVYGINLLYQSYDYAYMHFLGRASDILSDIKLLNHGLTYIIGAHDIIMALSSSLVFLAIAICGWGIFQLWKQLQVAGAHMQHRAWFLCLLLIPAVISIKSQPKLPSAQDGKVLHSSSLAFLRAWQRDNTKRTEFARLQALTKIAPLSDVEKISMDGSYDVWFFIIESYGQCLLSDPELAIQFRPLMKAVEKKFEGEKFVSFSTISHSTVFGGGSWLAGATLLLGTPIEDQTTYDFYVRNRHKLYSLVDIFKANSYYTASLEPLTMSTKAPADHLYSFHQTIRQKNLDYHGIPYAWAPPDQYALGKLWENHLVAKKDPLFIQVRLTSTHSPWLLPPLAKDWHSLQEKQVITKEYSLAPMLKGLTRKSQFAATVVYEWEVLTDFIEHHLHRPTLVFFIGDHQPTVSHEVNFRTIVHAMSNEPRLIHRLSALGWDKGMLPDTGWQGLKHQDVARILLKLGRG